MRRHEEDWSNLSREIVQTFSPSAPIEEREVFAGRSEQLGRLVRAVDERGRHAIVYGERGVGKTSLANVAKVVLHKPDGRLFHVRVNAAKGDSFDSLFRKVFQRFFYTSDEGRRRAIADDYAGIGFTPDAVQIELEGFAATQQTVIVIDEFDRIRDEATKDGMADLLKSLSDFSVNATIIIVGISENVADLILEHNSNIRSLLHVQMPRMSREELAEIIHERYARLGLESSDEALWKMTFLARGLPYYAHLLGMHSALAAVRSRRERIEARHVDEALESAISDVDATVVEGYLKAVVSQKGDATLYEPVLLACALAPTDELGRFQASAISEPLARIKGKKIPQSNYAFHMNLFCQEERGPILERVGEARNYRYHFKEAIMQPFVVIRGLQKGLIDDRTANVHSDRGRSPPPSDAD